MFPFINRYFSEEIKPKQLLHLILTISLLAASVQLISSMISEPENTKVAFGVILLAIILICFIANIYLEKNTSFLIYSVLAPISNAISVMCLGINFQPSANAIAIVCFVFMFFKEKHLSMFFLITYNIILTAGSMMYVVAFKPIYSNFDIPYDEIGVLLFSTIWVLLVLVYFKNKNHSLVRKLEQKNQKLVALTEELEYFNYMATHDLKAPIRNTKSFLMLIKKRLDAKRYDETEELFDYALTGINGIEQLTNDIMSLGAVNNSLKNADKIPIDLNKIVDEVEQLLISSNDDVKIVSDLLPVVMGNRTEFFQLFANFIENGVKYNRSNNPIIEILDKSSENDLKISISDNGIGIEKENTDKIFDFFTRLHSSREFKGSGLGLGLCNKIIKAYGGTIDTESKVNIGSTFTIFIPRVIQA